jgi:hypothetical protein
MSKYSDYLGLGIAGNFALHLDQAGEAEDFKNIITADEAAPKGIFPFYLPCQITSHKERPREILSTYPLSSTHITLPKTPLNVQAEPEVALVCELRYEQERLAAIQPKEFAAYNDCSIRVSGAQKISDKKNWGENTKGIAQKCITIDKFSQGGIMDEYSICSFLERDGILHPYGEDIALTAYSYFYEQLIEWIINQINTQEDFGPLESIKEYIKICNRPKKLLISIGATRYTPYGEKTFLQTGDKLFVALYKHTLYTNKDVVTQIKTQTYDAQNMSILAQKIE